MARAEVAARGALPVEEADEHEQGVAAALELLNDADDRVDLYGMAEEEAELYLSTHYSQVVAHYTLCLSVLVQMIKQGGAEEIARGYVGLTEAAIKLLRKMARGRSWNPLRTVRPHRQFAKCVLREWEDMGKVRLSVLSSMPRTLNAHDYRGQPTGAVEWDAKGKATISLGPD